MTRALLCFLLGAAMLVFAPLAAAMETVRITGPVTEIELIEQLDLYSDPLGTLGYADVLALPDEAWATAGKLRTSSEFRRKTHWFRFRIANATAESLGLYLEFPKGDLNRIDLYQSGAQRQLTHLLTGRDIATRDRPVAHRQLMMPITLAPDSENVVYVRVFGSGSFQLPLRLWDALSFVEHDRLELLELGAYFGVLVLVLFYILIISATLREMSLLTFGGFIASFGVLQLGLFGIGSEYVWRDQLALDRLITFVSICTGLLCACWFTINTLELRERNPSAMSFLEVMMIMTVTVVLISPFLTYEQMAPIISALTIPTCLAILSVGIFESYRGSQMARHFTLSWSLLLIGIMTLALSRLGLVPSNLVTEQAAFIGFIVMVIQMSWSIASEYNRQRYQNQLREEREARALQDALTARLEESVRERTRELEEALAELSDANAALKELSTIDSLTGIHNRYYFDEVFVKEWKRAIRERYPITVMLVDADHFKRINDTLGHVAGDHALRHLARSIKQILRRPADILARYGGEEFVVVLPYISNENAVHLAEQIRSYVENSPADAEGEIIHLTISIGVATARPHDDEGQQELLEAADAALYEAKDGGRNRVRNAGELAARETESGGPHRY